MGFSVNSDLFRGPIDLLLFLVRRHELDLSGISLAAIAQQFGEYLDVLEAIEVDAVGDFIEVASQLVEMKSRAVLPRNEFNSDDFCADPREDLVHRLLMYKKFKDAAVLLEEQSQLWQMRSRRLADDLPAKQPDFSDQPIRDLELWDLVSAFGRVLRDNLPRPQENIVYDETPIQIYMQQIHSRLAKEGHLLFTSLFMPGMHKSAMVGIFLAVLELARYHNIETRQLELHTEIDIVAAAGFDRHAEFADADNYGQKTTIPGDPASLVE